LPDQRIRFGEEGVALADLDQRFRRFLKSFPDPVVFVRGDKSLDFGQVAEVIDIAKGAGVNRIALLTER
jgi:biopolymer transport protein TolR